MKTYLTILGCGSSMGVPRADGFWGACDKTNVKNYRTRCSALISRGKNNILIDTSPDLRSQLLENKIVSISSVIYSHQHAEYSLIIGLGLPENNSSFGVLSIERRGRLHKLSTKRAKKA